MNEQDQRSAAFVDIVDRNAVDFAPARFEGVEFLVRRKVHGGQHTEAGLANGIRRVYVATVTLSNQCRLPRAFAGLIERSSQRIQRY